MSKQDSRPPSDRSSLLLHEAVERDLDANYHQLALPHPNRAIAIWYLLTVLEDSLRSLFALSDDSHRSIVEFQLDRQKYSARFALDRIRRECMDTTYAPVPARVIPKLYIKTAELLQAGVDFMAATQLCSSAHAGTVIFIESDHTIDIVFDEIHHDKRYAALELLGHIPVDVIDHSTKLYAWVRHDELRPRVVNAIARSVQIIGRKVTYKYEPHLAVGLSQEMMQQPSLVPEGWRFPWGGRRETILLVNALCVRCIYHWSAVHFGAGLNGLRGGGEASLLQVTTIPELMTELREMCSLDESTIRSFIRYLTYGHGMNNPDPALQPIIALGNGLMAIPCLMFLSSNYERNLLGLQARIDSSTFDTMSKLFESNMVHDLLLEIAPRWPFVKGNITVRANGNSEEIDLLVADLSSRTLLACELRWMLQPGDPREVQNRKKVCHQKVSQIARKAQWLQSQIQAGLDVLGVKVTGTDSWRVEGVVVIKTFGGTLSRDTRYPIITERIFIQGMQHATSLMHFANWSQSLCWLPKEEVHFRVVPQEMPLDTLGKHLVGLGMEKLCSQRTYTEFVKQSLASPDG
ncbi:hypothetical protein [Paraburkholderia nemoris]|uniref:hypothetical protein n=1 Tax=Paraburkholderia nemoris TaxID=2793076 RepID=UPI0038B7FDC0